jgi:hypothetical protein
LPLQLKKSMYFSHVDNICHFYKVKLEKHTIQKKSPNIWNVGVLFLMHLIYLAKLP